MVKKIIVFLFVGFAVACSVDSPAKKSNVENKRSNLENKEKTFDLAARTGCDCDTGTFEPFVIPFKEPGNSKFCKRVFCQMSFFEVGVSDQCEPTQLKNGNIVFVPIKGPCNSDPSSNLNVCLEQAYQKYSSALEQCELLTTSPQYQACIAKATFHHQVAGEVCQQDFRHNNRNNQPGNPGR